MATIMAVKNWFCPKAPGANSEEKAQAKANCEANMERVDVKACSYGTSLAKTKSCIRKLVPSIYDAPTVTADGVVKKLGRGETPSEAELKLITPEYIKGLIANKDKDNSAAIKLGIIEEAAKTNGSIKTAFDAANASSNATSGSAGNEEGLVLEASAIIPPALRFNADGFGSQYDTAGLVRPYAVASGGQSSNGDNSFNGVAPRLTLLNRHKLSKDFTLSYGARLDIADYKIKDSNSILNDENKFDLLQFTGSAVLRGAFTMHDYFALYGEVASGLRVSTGSGRVATGAPAGDKDENAFTADKVPSQLVGEASVGVQIGPRDSVHVNAHVGMTGTIHDFTPQTVLVEGAASPTPVNRDGGILTGGLTLVMPFQAVGRFFKRIFN